MARGGDLHPFVGRLPKGDAMKSSANSQHCFTRSRGSHKRLFGGLVLVLGISFTTSALVGPLCVSASAQAAPEPSEAEKKKLELEKQREEARKIGETIADGAYGTVMKLNSDVAKAFNIVKAVVKQDPFAFVNAFLDLFVGEDGGPPDIAVRQALDTIIKEIQVGRQEELIGRTEGLIDLFGILVSNPKAMTTNGLLADYISESVFIRGELRKILTSTDPERASMAYHLVPAFNTVTSALVAGLAVSGEYPQSQVDRFMEEAYQINLAMAFDDDSYGGYLYNYVQKIAGPIYCISTYSGSDPFTPADLLLRYEMDLTDGWHFKVVGEQPPPPVYNCESAEFATQIESRFDADPIVHLIRRSVVEHLFQGNGGG